MASLPFVCVCMCTEPHHWAQRGQREGVMLLKSTTPICLSVRCLAWLSSTQWWCWQNDRRGAHSSECQFCCKAPFPQERRCSHTPKQKRERAVVYKKASPTDLNIYIKHIGSCACITTYSPYASLLCTAKETASQQSQLAGMSKNPRLKFHLTFCHYDKVVMVCVWAQIRCRSLTQILCSRSFSWLAYCPDLTCGIRDAF